MQRQRAACASEDPELFFPVGTSGPALLQVERAKAICRACPIQEACLKDALERNLEFGVWGGHSEDERRAILRRGGVNVRSKGADHRTRTDLVRELAGAA
jgi:WhiB family redox-sensing transcriptional regulator